MTLRNILSSSMIMVGFTLIAGSCTLAGHGGISDLAGLGGALLGIALVPLGLRLMN